MPEFPDEPRPELPESPGPHARPDGTPGAGSGGDGLVGPGRVAGAQYWLRRREGPRQVVFVLDRSASMRIPDQLVRAPAGDDHPVPPIDSGLAGRSPAPAGMVRATRWWVARQALGTILAGLDARDRFNILLCGAQPQWLGAARELPPAGGVAPVGAQPPWRYRARTALSALKAYGTGDLHAALLEALAARPAEIAVLTDGMPSRPQAAPARAVTREEVDDWFISDVRVRTETRIPVSVLAVGLADAAARGFYRRLSDAPILMLGGRPSPGRRDRSRTPAEPPSRGP